MIAPADFNRPGRPENTDLDSSAADDLLPWADPYIAQLFRQHHAEVDSAARKLLETRRVPARLRREDELISVVS